MSFIGSGELEHKITQLQRQLSHKDHELNSIKNEQAKKQEEVEEAKRAKQTAEYKLRDEADRALKAENTLEKQTSELSQYKLKLSNLESSLTQTSDKLKKEEREKERLQDALDETLSRGSDGAAAQMRDQQARIKQLEHSLKRSEEEKEKALSCGSSGGAWGSDEPLNHRERNRLMSLQNENAELKSKLESVSPAPFSSSELLGSTSPPSQRGKRRSLSVSAADVRELEVQVETLKTQLSNTKRDYDKAVNEKLAAEVSARKSTERLETDLDEAKNELNYYRYNQGETDPKQLAQLQKDVSAVRAEKDQLVKLLSEKEAEVKQQSKVMLELEREIKAVESLREELESERQARQQFEQITSSTSVDEETAARINELEAELAKAKAASTTAMPRSDSELRQARRDLQKAIRDKEYLESLVKENDDLLAEKDEEISKLRTAVPLPGSPLIGAQSEAGLVALLEEEKAALKEELSKQIEQYAEEMRMAETQLTNKCKELEDVKTVEEDYKRRYIVASSDLQEARDTMAAKDAESQQVANKLTRIQRDLSEQQEAIVRAQADAAAAMQKRTEAEADLSEKEQVLQELRCTIASRSHDDVEFEELTTSMKIQTNNLAQVNDALSQSKINLAEFASRMESAEKASKIAKDAYQQLEKNESDAQRRVEDLQAQIVSQKLQSQETIAALSYQLEALNADVDSLRNELHDKTLQLEEITTSSQTIQDYLEQSHKKVNDLQTRIAEMETQEDEAVSAKAEEKDAHIKDIKEQKMSMEMTLKRARKEVDSELTIAKAQYEEALIAAQGRVAQLDQQVTALQRSENTSSSSMSIGIEDVQRLEQKVERLRAERDDLRHNISFVQNERHFAVRAAIADMDAAAEQARKAREELRKKNVACDKLQEEIRELNQHITDNQVIVTDDKQALADRVSTLENDFSQAQGDVVAAQDQVTQLESQCQARESDLKKAEAQANALRNELTEVLHHLAESKSMTDRPESRMSKFSEQEDAAGDLPRSRKISHTRSNSAASISMVQHAQTEKMLQAKIERRDARISIITNDLSKVRANMALLEAAQEETMAETAELAEERDRLRSCLEAARCQEEDSDSAAQGLVLALIVYRQQARCAESRWQLAQEILSKSRGAAQGLISSESSAQEKVCAGEKRFAEVEANYIEVAGELQSAKRHSIKTQTELQDALATIDNLQARLEEIEHASITATEAVLSMRAVQTQIAEKEQLIVEIKAQNAELALRLNEAEQELIAAKAERDESISRLSSKITELEDQLGSAREEVRRAKEERDQLLEDLTAAEKALADGMENVETQKDALETRQRDHEASLAGLNRTLEEKSRELAEAILRSESLTEVLNTLKARTAETTATFEDHQATIDQLRVVISTLQEAHKTAEAERASLGSQLVEAEGRVSIAEMKAQGLESEISQRLEEVEKITNKAHELSDKLEQVIMDNGESMRNVSRELEQAFAAKAEAEKTLTMKEQDISRLHHELRTIKDKQQSAEQKSEESIRRSETLQADLSNLRTESDKMKDQLTKALASSSSPAAHEQQLIDLKEHISELEAALTQKNKEVDEADDQTREAFKAKARLEKKVAKLQRQLEQAQVDANTAMNKIMSSQPIAAIPTPRAQPTSISAAAQILAPIQPPSVPAAHQRAQSSPAVATARTPRSIPPNIFSPPAAPYSGHKRHREIDDVEIVPKPAEAIIQAPSFASPRRALGTKSSFTPQRGSAFTHKPSGVDANSENTIGEVKRPVAALSRNIFAKPSPVKVDPAKRTTFPAPASRTPFAPAPRNAS